MANARLYRTQSHATWRCEYHIVWCPKYRGRVLKDTYIKQELQRLIKQIARWKGFNVLAWHIGDEHIHLYLVVPPKYSVSYAIQLIKGKTSHWIKKKTKKFPRGSLWARGYFVTTTGLNEHAVRTYINNQSHHQVSLIQEKLFGS